MTFKCLVESLRKSWKESWNGRRKRSRTSRSKRPKQNKRRMSGRSVLLCEVALSNNIHIQMNLLQSKFMSLQTTHNTTTTSLQRELDTVRKDYQQVRVQLRELEMGNDDLERNERAISSSLADIEQKYSRVLEEKILLEHELLDKANVEEEYQRLKDELRGM